jgi:cell division protein ZapA
MPKTEIQILGQKYALKGESSEEHLKQVASFLDGKIREVLGKSPNMTPLNAAILAALNITQELFDLRKEREIITKEVEKKAIQLSELFD